MQASDGALLVGNAQQHPDDVLGADAASLTHSGAGSVAVYATLFEHLSYEYGCCVSSPRCSSVCVPAGAPAPLLPGGSMEAQTGSHGAAAEGSACSTATAERPLKARPASGGTPAAADAAAADEASGAGACAAEPGGLSRTTSGQCAPDLICFKHHCPGSWLGLGFHSKVES